MTIDRSMNRFRLASRELFNQYFRIDDPYENNGWDLEEDFSQIEQLLFQKLVAEKYGLPTSSYGRTQKAIVVKPITDGCPWMLNRELPVAHGYWDYPDAKFLQSIHAEFVRFFDFDWLAYRDYRYVMVFVSTAPGLQEIENRYALVETQYVRYSLAKSL